MRVGLLYPGPDPLSPATWSGSPFGLATGLAALGVEVVPLAAKLPLGAHQAVAVLSRATGKRGAVAERTPVRLWSRTAVLERQVRRQASSLDAVIAMGLELFDLDRVRTGSTPVATFDDATLQQMWREPESDIRISHFPEHEVERWIAQQRQSARAATVCCVSTGYAADSFVEDYGIPDQRVAVVGMGHRPRERPPQSRRDWSTPRFLFVGVEWRRKNGQRVLEAFERIHAENPQARLDLVGAHPPVDQPGVVGHGYLPREDPEAQRTLDALFETATAFVLPSRYDLSPISYLEAASVGLPVLGSSAGGAGEVLGDAALSVAPDDVVALTEAMRTLAHPGTAQRMGALAAEAAADCTWPKVASRILAALDLSAPPDREDAPHGVDEGI